MFLFMDVLRNTYSLNIDELFRVCGIVTTVAINKCFAQFFVWTYALSSLGKHV